MRTPRILTAAALAAALVTLTTAAAVAPAPNPAVTAEADGHVLAQPDMDATLIALSPAQVRVDPGFQQPVVGTLQVGVEVSGSSATITEEATGTQWYAVELDAGTWGWVHSGDVALVVDAPRLDRLGIKPQPHSTGVGLGSAAVAALSQSAPVFAYPTAQAPRLGQVEPGEAVQTSESTQEGDVGGAALFGDNAGFRYVSVVGRSLEGWTYADRVYLTPDDDALLARATQRTVSTDVDLVDVPASVGAEVVETVDAGTELMVGQTLVDGWTAVEWDDEVMWVQAEDLAATDDPSASPTSSTWEEIKYKAKDEWSDIKYKTDELTDKASEKADDTKTKLDPLREVKQWGVVALLVVGLGTAVAFGPRVTRLFSRKERI